MAQVPDYIINKTAVKFQTAFILFGLLAFFIAFGAFSNDEPMAGVTSAGIGIALVWIGSLIKTKRKLRGGNLRFD